MERPTSTQIGAIAVNHVANALMISSKGRFSVFTPVADDDGLDLLVYDKTSGHAFPIQVKSRTVTLKRRGSADRGNIAHFELRKATYHEKRYAYAVLVLLSTDAATVERAWLVPMRDLAKYAASRKNKFVLRPSKVQFSTDRYTTLQCEDLAELCERLLDELRAREASTDISK